MKVPSNCSRIPTFTILFMVMMTVKGEDRPIVHTATFTKLGGGGGGRD